jgi:hypothetical protein
MAGEQLTQVYVPRIFESPDAIGVVVGRLKREGEWLDSDEALLRVRSREVDGEILAPFAGKLVRLHVVDGDAVSAGSLVAEIRRGTRRPQRAPRTRLPAATVAQAEIVAAAAVSAIALVWPVFALLLLGVPAGLGAGVRLARRSSGRAGEALSMLFVGTVRLARFGVLAAAVVATLGGLTWLLSQGTHGLVAAVRLAAFEHGPRLLAFAIAFRQVRGWLAGSPKAERLRTLVGGAPIAAAVVGMASALVWLGACAIVLPRAIWWPAASFHAATGVLSQHATDWVRRRHATWVQTEAVAVRRCLAERRRGNWDLSAVAVRQDGSIVVSMRPARGDTPGDRSLATLELALQNQLEPHRVTVVIHRSTHRFVRFQTLARARPVTDVGDVLRSTAGAPPLAAIEAVKSSDVDVALQCSAVAF